MIPMPKKEQKNTLLWIAAGALLAILIVNVVLSLTIGPATPKTATQEAPKSVDMMIITEPSCTNCFDASLYQPELERIGVTFGKVSTSERGTTTADRLIKKYGITKLPALVFSKELGTYSSVANAWSRVGTIADDGSYILQGNNPPYYEIATGKTVGLISLTYLNDSTCAECYDVTQHRQILEQFGMKVTGARVVDIASNEGKALLAQYNITDVPTVIVTGDVAAYPGFDSVWQSVGDVQNGAYVFKNLDALNQPYEDLATGKVVTPPPKTQ